MDKTRYHGLIDILRKPKTYETVRIFNFFYLKVQTKVHRGVTMRKGGLMEWSVLTEKEILQLIDNTDHNVVENR